VKGLLLLPSMEMATTKQVAEFYEVDAKAIRKIIQRHKDELVADGLIRMKGKEIIEKINTRDNKSHLSITRKHGGFLLNEETVISYSGDNLFPKRAILRVGMLLRDSVVAKEIRTQLLNIEEKAPEAIKVSDINEEDKLALSVIKAPSKAEQLIAFSDYNHYKNKHIERQQKIIEEQKPKVVEFDKLLSGNILLTATELSSMYVGKNGTKVEPRDINAILVKEGFLVSRGKNLKYPSKKGIAIGGSEKKIRNGCTEVVYTQWSIKASRELDGVFRKYHLIGNIEKEPVLS
jgi:phage antirepressor YoqD-like protein